MMNMFATILTSLASSGILVWVFKEWLSTRLRTSIQHEYDRKLESLKADLSREAAFHAAAHSSFAEGQKAAMERKLAAIDRLWQSLIRFRASLPPILGFMDILTVDEYKGARNHPTFRQLTGEMSSDKIIAMSAHGAEDVRPFVGEYIWSLFFSYRAILLRVALLVTWGRDDAEKIEWFKDEATRQVIQAVLTPEEMTAFDNLQFQKIFWLQRQLEGKILAAMHKIISGEDFVPKSIEQISVIQSRLAQLESKNREMTKKKMVKAA